MRNCGIQVIFESRVLINAYRWPFLISWKNQGPHSPWNELPLSLLSKRIGPIRGNFQSFDYHALSLNEDWECVLPKSRGKACSKDASIKECRLNSTELSNLRNDRVVFPSRGGSGLEFLNPFHRSSQLIEWTQQRIIPWLLQFDHRWACIGWKLHSRRLW